MESKVFENIKPKTPKSILPDGFQYRMMKTYFVDADTKESKLGMKQALVQNDRVHEYASEFRVISETELRLASSGFLDIEGVREEALYRLANPNDSDIEAGYKPNKRPKKNDVIAKCELVKQERVSLALEKEAQAKVSLSLLQKDKKNER